MAVKKTNRPEPELLEELLDANQPSRALELLQGVRNKNAQLRFFTVI